MTAPPPLAGVRVVQLASLAPGPFAAMLLADLGAEVLRVDRIDAARAADPARSPADVLGRGQRSISVDLKHPDGIATVLRLLDMADVLIEGFRPGVTERLGIGPDMCLGRNPRLVYGRMTGWGQDGPYAPHAGHDINYIALSGALYQIGPGDGPPVPPLNLLGDYGGGGLLLAFGIVSALFERVASGQGQVIDAAMVDGAALLTSHLHGLIANGDFHRERGDNALDMGAHWFSTYETADGEFVSVGAVEPQFYAELLERLGLGDEAFPQDDHAAWPDLKQRFSALFKTRSRTEWCEILEHTDACFAPVLSPAEVADHPHNRARSTFIEVAGLTQPAPAPRFSRTPHPPPSSPPHPGRDTRTALPDWGFSDAEVTALLDAGAVY